VIHEDDYCRRMTDEITLSMRIMIENSLNTLTSGNASYFCRKKGFIILTPTGVEKLSLRPEDLVYYDISRNIFIGERNPTSEYNLHLKVYFNHPNILSIAHAHNPLSIRLYDEKGLNPFIDNNLVETRYVLGRVCSAQGDPGSLELSQNVARLAGECDVIIIPRHGAFSFSATPMGAVERLFALEYVSKYFIGGRT
jgi:L-fuculose-phosphate aldolase